MRICRRVFVSDKAFTALPVRSPTKQPGWCTSSKPKQILLQKQLPTPTQALRVKLKNVRRPMWTCASAEASETSQSETPKPLEVFLGWATFNGVKGVGSADSKVALFESNEGERGLIAVKDIAEGEELVTVPLRIALTDHPEDEESNYLLYQDAPWSVRLAAKILREKAKGSNSPWKSYIDVLPTTILSPLTNFSWEEMLEVQYEPAKNSIFEAHWLAAESYKRCSSAAISGATESEFRWALSVVHSRTFGTAAKTGGVGVRLLVPVIDMINHAGDWGGAATGEYSTSQHDVASWQLCTPEKSASGEWEMILRSTSEIEEGDEVFAAVLFSNPSLRLFEMLASAEAC
mmetsp:Transcript_40319/g.95819  ORF Transcript_40319/g.95819 Transcript_40319/m.95819 type:complete len:347 (+) Transcript_40319:75-1115(+)